MESKWFHRNSSEARQDEEEGSELMRVGLTDRGKLASFRGSSCCLMVHQTQDQNSVKTAQHANTTNVGHRDDRVGLPCERLQKRGSTRIRRS